eukprot:Phypoly_transcript_03596.p1 GENE.Phypoly_transcript_03596~~Phypoly_transcript_03596.p1  ORF type:complete len:629 (+),score=84.13 Phypoly_transcript_03596:526-2412(+)
MSKSDPTQDLITNINPAYVTIITTAQGDEQLLTVATLPVISSFLDFLTGEYIDLVSSQYTPQVLSNTLPGIYTFLAGHLSLDLPGAQQYFFSCWANGTTLPIFFMNWPGMFPTISDASAVIPETTVAQLFSNDSYSLLDSKTASIVYWMRASGNESGPEATALMKTFNLTAPQLHTVLLWRNTSFVPLYVHPILISMAAEIYPTESLSDVGWVQYVTANFTQPSISDVYGHYYHFPSPFELAVPYPVQEEIYTVGQIKYLLAGPNTILNINNFGLFSTAAFGGDTTPWGLDTEQSLGFLVYMNNSLVTNYSQPIVTGFVTSGATGVIMTKSADYWLWRCVDPLVAMLMGPENAYCGLQTNSTIQPASQIYTGKRNLTQLGSYVSWRNQSSVNFWNGTVQVSGWTDNGQFCPFLKDNQTLYVWDESFVKTLEFDEVGKTQVQGIDVNMYTLNANTFGVSELYMNKIEGFANETSTNQGAPIFLSNFDFYGVTDPKYKNFSGLQPNNSDVTTIYVEPITGSTLQADEKLQVNVYYPPQMTGWNQVFWQFKNIKTDVIYPLMKAWQQSSVSTAQAKKLRAQLVVFSPKFNSGLLWGLVAFGAFLGLVGIFMIVLGVKRRQRDGYHPININI